ncbi:hypothetical protein E2L00_13470 [Cedecea colo]|uniref:Uncharacterized protein n=1 Tax=Cedecea colo TaxID=2552946 RepID=A0ABX0VND3_9ENTR|nr:hypothetical protein [Cedecea colo]
MLANSWGDFHLLAGNVHCHKVTSCLSRLGNFSIPRSMSKCVIKITLFCHFLSRKPFCETEQDNHRYCLWNAKIAFIFDGMA